jgi:hypothetical protein
MSDTSTSPMTRRIGDAFAFSMMRENAYQPFEEVLHNSVELAQSKLKNRTAPLSQ